MKLKLALQGQDSLPRDIVVDVDATATIADLAEEILRTHPRLRATADASGVTLSVAPAGSADYQILDPGQQLGEARLGSGYDVKIMKSGAPSGSVARQPGPPIAILRVLNGPDAGREYQLRAGPNVIGRESGCDVIITDSEVSRRHARIEIGTSVEVVDLNSANGIEVDGGLVTRATLAAGQAATIGSTSFTVELARQPTAEPSLLDTSVSGGSAAFNRSPNVESRYPWTEYPRPDVPSEIDKQPFPWLMMIAPVAMGLVVFAVTQNPLSLVFVAMSPLMLVSNYLMTRMRNQRRLGAQITRFNDQLVALDARLSAENPRERQVRNAETPTTAQMLDEAMHLSPHLWTRRPEHWNFLHLRLATGRTASRNTVAAAPDRADGLPELEDQLVEVIERHRMINDVPIVESLAMAGALGVAGPKERAVEATQALLAQLVCLHSPLELVVAALGGSQTAHDFEWLKWVPHTSSPQSPIVGSHLAIGPATAGGLLSQLEALTQHRYDSGISKPRGPLASDLVATARGGGVGTEEMSPPVASSPAIVLLIGADAPISRGRAIQLAERCADAGIYTIWVDSEPSRLPAVCRTFVDVTGTNGVVGFVRHGLVVREAAVEVVRSGSVSVLGKHLAGLADAGGAQADQTDLPRSVAMLALLGRGVAEDEASVVDRWRENLSLHDLSGAARPSRRAGSLRALVGLRGADAMHLDLRADGPHALVGGTTGAGKSEFLQSWVLGMAAEYSPDRVTFLFVDYKGGAAFADCVNLPHCVGLVTDLSPHLVRRALTSLKAELRRREDVLNHKKAKDILELEKRGDPECPPALVLVIDEFAALASEVPEFVDGVVDIAQRGRSLGINLIMATQRPAGVIKDNLRANTNLRIALRMADESDSSDVVSSPVAAGFDPSIPGRAIAKTGPGRLVPFQAGYTGGWTSDEPAAPSILIRDLIFGSGPEWEKPPLTELPSDPGPNDLARAVHTISGAAASVGVRPPRRPWLNELSRVVDLAALGPRTDAALILGLVDRPDTQSQTATFFEPDVDGNLAIYGTGGSGKTVLLRSLAVGAGITPRGGPVHVYGLDFAAGGLRMLEVLPHVGSIISGDDSERVGRLLREIKGIADQRSRSFPAVNASNIAEYRTLAGKPEEPRILLLVDGFPAFRTEYEGAGTRAIAYATLQQLIVEGRQLGIHIAFTADRPAGVPGAIASSVPRRVVLRMAEESMYLILDAPSDVVGPTSPPGRAVIDGLETQVAVLGGSANAADQYEALTRLARTIDQQKPVHAPEIRSMPTEVSAESLPSAIAGSPVLGISEVDLQPIAFAAEGVFLLGGGPGSGRSSGLAALVNAVRRAEPTRRFYYLGHRRSALPNSNHWDAVATSPEAAAELAKQLTEELQADSAPLSVVILETLADFQGTPADAAIVAMTKVVKRSGHLLIAESDSGSWNSSFPLFMEIKGGRRGVLLQPDMIEGDTILKTSFPRLSRAEFPPGRGMFVSGGKAVRVQLPLVDGQVEAALPSAGASG